MHVRRNSTTLALGAAATGVAGTAARTLAAALPQQDPALLLLDGAEACSRAKPTARPQPPRSWKMN